MIFGQVAVICISGDSTSTLSYECRSSTHRHNDLTRPLPPPVESASESGHLIRATPCIHEIYAEAPEDRSLILRERRVVHFFQQRPHQRARWLPILFGEHIVFFRQGYLAIECEVSWSFQANDELHVNGQVLSDEAQNSWKVKVVLCLLIWRIDDHWNIVRAFLALYGAPDGGVVGKD